MKKYLMLSVVVAFALITMSFAYLFHDYISGNRWSWLKGKVATLASTTVIFGKEGDPFSDARHADIDDSRGLANPGNKVARLKETLTKRNEIVRSLGGRFLYVICPISETVYNELLPPEHRKVGNCRRATIVMEEMRGSGVEMLYLTPAVTEAKVHGRVFYKLDPHWNRLGAYVGSQAVASYLSQYYPAVMDTLGRLSEYELVSQPPDYGTHLSNNTVEMDPEPVPKAGWSARMETKQFGQYRADVFTKDDPSLPTMVMFGDSFMAEMRKPMAEHFRRAVFVNPWITATKPLSPTFTDFPVEIIEAERPDLVIYDRWERAFLLSNSEWESIATLPPAR